MWKKILKFEIRSFEDARRAGKEYALEDYYESMLLSEEEYQNLTNKEKLSIHQRLQVMLIKYGKDSWANERRKFHGTMATRVRSGKETTMLPTEDYKPRRPKEVIEAERREKQQRREERQRRKEEKERTKEERRRAREAAREERRRPRVFAREGARTRRTREEEERREKRKTTSQMILDYFKMWKNMYNRLPTLTEITNSEGRPLTVDEETTYNEQYARETQE